MIAPADIPTNTTPRFAAACRSSIRSASRSAWTPASTSPPPTNTRSTSPSAARAPLASFFFPDESLGQTTLRMPAPFSSAESAVPKPRSSALAAPT